MRYGSLFSGIGGFDLGMDRAGMSCAFQVEIDNNCQSILKRHWPEVTHYEDVATVGADNLVRPDVLVGGFPCQDVSVAGRRAGLDGKRSGLWFEFHRLIASLQPRWVVIENVPGLLSSNGGRDFAAILRGLVECGYGVTWRVLDAQFFGVPQRRRRVFIVGSLGNGRAAQVLFERKGVCGNTPPSRETGQRVADSLTVGANQYSGFNGFPVEAIRRNDDDRRIRVINPGEAQRQRVYDAQGIAPCLASEEGRGHGTPTVAYAFAQNQAGDVLTGDVMHALGTNGNSTGRNAPTVAYAPVDLVNVTSNVNRTRVEYGIPSPTLHQDGGRDSEKRENRSGVGLQPDLMYTLQGEQQHALISTYGVRRLTPRECERLQGFPDDWTAYGFGSKPMSDSARYKMCGNAVCVNVAEWIAHRIVLADA